MDKEFILNKIHELYNITVSEQDDAYNLDIDVRFEPKDIENPITPSVEFCSSHFYIDDNDDEITLDDIQFMRGDKLPILKLYGNKYDMYLDEYIIDKVLGYIYEKWGKIIEI
jgi:hypothetical protein